MCIGLWSILVSVEMIDSTYPQGVLDITTEYAKWRFTIKHG